MRKIKNTSMIIDSIMRLQRELGLDENAIKKRLEYQNAVRVYDRVREDLEKVATDEKIAENNNIEKDAIGKDVLCDNCNLKLSIASYNNHTLETLKEIYDTFEDEIGEDIPEFIEKILKAGYDKEGISEDVSVEVLLTDPKIIARLNQEYRNNPKTTDVLSFPRYTKEELYGDAKDIVFGHPEKSEMENSLGSMAISLARVYRNGRRLGTGLKRELAYMVVHSFYHLLGEDHMNEEEKKQMREKEEELLGELEI